MSESTSPAAQMAARNTPDTTPDDNGAKINPAVTDKDDNGAKINPAVTDKDDNGAKTATTPPKAAKKRGRKAKDDPNGTPPVGRYRSVHRGMRDPYSGVEFNSAYAVPVDADACTNWLQCQVIAGLIVKE